jgi:hypothetical protein
MTIMTTEVLIERLEFHSLGRAACRDGRMAAAIVAGAVPAVGLCSDLRPTSPTMSDGGEDSSADDNVGVAAAAAVSVLPVEGDMTMNSFLVDSAKGLPMSGRRTSATRPLTLPLITMTGVRSL